MFHLASPAYTRRFILAGLIGAVVLCLGLGSAAWYLTRCDMRDYLNRAAVSPASLQERYLFACGHVWHSRDAGRVWVRMASTGLPFGTRDGHIAADRKAGYLYLGLLINTQGSIYCPLCAWTNLRPAIYISTDGGRRWTFAYKFKRGPAGDGGFLGLFADPDREGAAYAVIKNSDEITYYATGTSGHFWKQNCVEYYFIGSGRCKLPEKVIRLQFHDAPAAGVTGE